jgi:hypothetical protein
VTDFHGAAVRGPVRLATTRPVSIQNDQSNECFSANTIRSAKTDTIMFPTATNRQTKNGYEKTDRNQDITDHRHIVADTRTDVLQAAGVRVPSR